MQRGKNWSFIV